MITAQESAGWLIAQRRWVLLCRRNCCIRMLIAFMFYILVASLLIVHLFGMNVHRLFCSSLFGETDRIAHAAKCVPKRCLHKVAPCPSGGWNGRWGGWRFRQTHGVLVVMGISKYSWLMSWLKKRFIVTLALDVDFLKLKKYSHKWCKKIHCFRRIFYCTAWLVACWKCFLSQFKLQAKELSGENSSSQATIDKLVFCKCP